jgi:uncharacterized protein (TIGR03083 family)
MHPTWALAHAERATLAEDLSGLEAARWQTPSLCGDWTVREVLAHLTAAASLGPVAWMRSVIGARFDFDRHNALRLVEQLGNSPEDTLERFRRVHDSTTATWGPKDAWLGEVVIHGEDIRRPLGLPSRTPPPTAARLARFFSRTEFAVVSRSRIRGLRLEATDADFSVGVGPLVQGPVLSLLMVITGRAAHTADLAGPGVPALAARCAPGWSPKG